MPYQPAYYRLTPNRLNLDVDQDRVELVQTGSKPDASVLSPGLSPPLSCVACPTPPSLRTVCQLTFLILLFNLVACRLPTRGLLATGVMEGGGVPGEPRRGAGRSPAKKNFGF